MSDLIERQAAIKAMVEDKIQTKIYITPTAERDFEVFNGACDRHAKMLKELPSAQPEIIRCKDCKHSEHWYRDKRRCFLWHETGIDVFEDGFCNYAERRTDG